MIVNKNKKGLHESELLSSHWPVVSCCVERRRKWYMVGRVGFWNSKTGINNKNGKKSILVVVAGLVMD